MSEEWIPITKLWPDLPGKAHLHVLDCPPSELLVWLHSIGFSIVELSAAGAGERAFFDMAARAFGFEPAYLSNWDAWEDCLTEWTWNAPRCSAIVWSDSDEVFSRDAQLFSQVVFDLTRLAWSMALAKRKSGDDQKQVEVFLLGDSEGFARLSTPKLPRSP